MTIRLISAQSWDGEAVIIPQNWARLANPRESRVQVRDNTIETALAPGRYSLFLSGVISPVTFTAADEVSLNVPPIEKVTGVTATVEQD